MKVNLDKKGLVYLVLGDRCPESFIMDDIVADKLGQYIGSEGGWSWNYDNLIKMKKKELYSLYLKCRLAKEDE